LIELILGGTRAGKSRVAELRARSAFLNNPQQYKNLLYVATAEIYDNEIAERIKHHQQRRSDHWQLIEEPLKLGSVLNQHNHSDTIILIECLTMWLTNLLCEPEAELDSDIENSSFFSEKKQFIEQLQRSEARIIIVSNETGLGIVPLGELTRRYVDEAGMLHQLLAKMSERVTLVVAGLEHDLKAPAV